MLFLVVITAQLLAFILTLNSSSTQQNIWLNLALISLFIQWIALGNVFVLCISRNWLQNQGPMFVAIGSYSLSLLVTFTVSSVAVWLALLDELNYINDAYSYSGFITRNVAISAIVSAVALRYFYVQHQWKSNIETEAHSRIQALQARIRPHFLFNSMNTIASLTRTNPRLAERAVEDLADLFRTSLGHQETVKLSEELEFTRRYINIEELRLGNRLQVEWQVDKDIPPDATVPALILQPLVENSIYHGIEPQTSGGVVNISIGKANRSLQFLITNPAPTTKSQYRRSGNRMAQDNIRQRLKLAYGDASTLNINKTEAQYLVSFTIPIEKST